MADHETKKIDACAARVIALVYSAAKGHTSDRLFHPARLDSKAF